MNEIGDFVLIDLSMIDWSKVFMNEDKTKNFTNACIHRGALITTGQGTMKDFVIRRLED